MKSNDYTFNNALILVILKEIFLGKGTIKRIAKKYGWSIEFVEQSFTILINSGLIILLEDDLYIDTIKGFKLLEQVDELVNTKIAFS